MAEKKSPKEGSKFKDTLNLPRTDFPIRANSKVNDPIILEKWDKEKLHEKADKLNEGSKTFFLHDGPPYANGHIHLGHAYNKIMKDIVVKSRRMMGFHAPVTPGWDCHGLPIEQQVAKENPDLSGLEMKKVCRERALYWLRIQREEFKALGVSMNWDNPYITMAPKYEANTLRAFAIFVRDGFIKRQNKTIPWCATCKTALAAAEIEYEDRKDPSIYVFFELDQKTKEKEFSEFDKSISLLIWTTTPWTIPLNRAVVLKPKTKYQLIRIKDKLLVVGESLVKEVAKTVGEDFETLKSFDSAIFSGGFVHHPMVAGLKVPIIFDESVGMSEGTACVHSAPGCGPIDYEIAVKNNIEIYSPLTADGRYSDKIRPKELAGMYVADGQGAVIKKLLELEKLLFKGSIRHSYPHCWRCHQALIFRATPQWFCSLEHKDVKGRALKEADKIDFIPERGKNSLKAAIGSRWEWCISRQRSWGVPIPALISLDEKEVFINEDFIKKIADKVEKKGIEYWDGVSIEELLSKGIIPADFPIEEYKKETDTLDVWFDSGVSHFAVLKEENRFPADIYLEAVDQYRGWFQSSLLTSIILNDKTPTKSIMVHGFTVGPKGRKMSKSLGNVVAPSEVIEKIGTDGLRLWVSSIGNDRDLVISDVILRNVAEVYRKIRNSCRFLLQNLYDFDKNKDGVEISQLLEIDRYALWEFYKLNKVVIEHYEVGNFAAVFHALGDYCTVDLSAFYGDIVKDRLYCGKAGGKNRRSAQTVFSHILDGFIRLMAPVMSFTAEQVWGYLEEENTESIHLKKFASLNFLKKYFSEKSIDEYENEWKIVKDIRQAVLKIIETEREKGVIKHPLESQITLYFSDIDKIKILEKEPDKFFKELFIVSKVTFNNSSQGLNESSQKGLYVNVEYAEGVKCPRCWHWSTKADDEDLCTRCQKIL